jgi:hypothetical protein
VDDDLFIQQYVPEEQRDGENIHHQFKYKTIRFEK